MFDIDCNHLTMHIPSSIKEAVPNVTNLNYRTCSTAWPMTVKYHYKTGEDYSTNAFYQWLTSLNSELYHIELVEDN